MSVLARATAKREKPQDIARSPAFSPFVRSVGARVSVARRQLTTGISSEILCGADVVVLLVARVAAAAAADDDDKAGCSYWVSLSLSLSLSPSGCANAEGRAAVAVAEQRASVVHKTLLSPPPLPPPPLSGSSPLPARLLSLPLSLFSVGAVAGRLNALESGRERETDGERNSERPFERRRPVHSELQA